jgi:hypothetical protein
MFPPQKWFVVKAVAAPIASDMPRAHDRTNALPIKEFQEIEGWTPGRGNAAVVCKVQERVQSLAAFDAP